MLRVHSYETFATQDGPWIRIVFFLQWCNFRCLYCQNPDIAFINQGKDYSKEEIFQLIEREKVYFWNEWWVTFSGGNPLCQAKELKEVLKFLKEKQIHTCIDTNGFSLTDDVKACIELADLVLPDLKQIDNQKHQELTWNTNTMPLQFIQYLDQQAKNYRIRYVVLPWYTDQKEDLEKVWLFLQNLKHFQRIELLPYHTLGKKKWEALWMSYPLEHVNPCTPEEVSLVQNILKKYVNNVFIR